ncbi:alpha/beta hydrolase family protein [Microlunatus ginsengisoli]|uniref:Alpha/beta fold hydrolase n=1 Tax=Microlunatus ginsengisoli TaxID=363863 RepID=A0ABP6ZHS5_9ACTN
MTTTTVPRTAGTTIAQPVSRRFFTADDFDYNAKTMLGHAAQGVIDIGLALATLDRIPDGDAVGWYRAWSDTADTLREQGLASSRAGSEFSAAAFFLAASEAYDQALAFVDGMPDDSVLLPTFRLHRECWDRFVASSEGRHLPIAVPYEGDSMPGYLFRPDATGAARPTVVVTNGSDGSLAGLWAYVIKGALERGWNVFVFDGPGQQSMLFERDVPFRHDWEAVLTPVVDLLVARADVDADALLAYAISQGGYWLPRALAFEHRFVAAVVDGGVTDVARAWNRNLPPQLLAALRAGDRATFNRAMSAPATPEMERTIAFRAKPYGLTDPFDLFTEVNRYTLDGVVDKISTPMLITDPDDEQFFPGQPQELYDALTCSKVLLRFTAAEGANAHCEPMARHLVDLRMGDFFAGQLAESRA